MNGNLQQRKPPFFSVSGIYFAEGLPAVIAGPLCMIIFVMYGVPNDRMTFWTSLIALPWSLKCFWAPLLDSIWTNRNWMLAMQLLLAVIIGITGAYLGLAGGFTGLLLLFFAIAFCSATHDIAADGYYMKALTQHEQAVCSGLRNIFYKVAQLAGASGLGLLAGSFENQKTGWAWALFTAAAVMVLLFLVLNFTAPKELPQQKTEEKTEEKTEGKTGFFESFRSFFARPGAWVGILFLLFYRIAESQLARITTPFLMDSPEKGGLGMSVRELSIISSGAGAVCFLIGGVLAGIAVGKFGFGKCLFWMAAALNVPDVFYLILSCFPGLFVSGTSALKLTGAAMIALEQFGYGLGYMAHVLYMVQFADKSGRYKASHFALMTGITIGGMTLFGMFSGKIQMILSQIYGGSASYTPFFLWICLFTLPSFAVVYAVKDKIDPLFGKKQADTVCK